MRFQRLTWHHHVHAHDGRDVRSLQMGEHHVSALDAIGPNFRPVESSRAQPVVSSEVNKIAILLTCWAILLTFPGAKELPPPLECSGT